jgi:hypothetical protein
MVTAAVYWDYIFEAKTSPIHFSILQNPVFLLNSRHSRFVPSSFSIFIKKNKKKRFLFSRSYKIILPSSFNIIISNTLVYSTNRPVTVFGTVVNFKSLKIKLVQKKI